MEQTYIEIVEAHLENIRAGEAVNENLPYTLKECINNIEDAEFEAMRPELVRELLVAPSMGYSLDDHYWSKELVGFIKSLTGPDKKLKKLIYDVVKNIYRGVELTPGETVDFFPGGSKFGFTIRLLAAQRELDGGIFGDIEDYLDDYFFYGFVETTIKTFLEYNGLK